MGSAQLVLDVHRLDTGAPLGGAHLLERLGRPEMAVLLCVSLYVG
jgi:hypothetical protein